MSKNLIENKNRWSEAAWDAVAPWINQLAQTERDPESGGPYLPTLEVVERSLDLAQASVDALVPKGYFNRM